MTLLRGVGVRGSVGRKEGCGARGSAPPHAGAGVGSGTANPAGARSVLPVPPLRPAPTPTPSRRGAGGGSGLSSLGGDAGAPTAASRRVPGARVCGGRSQLRQLRPPSQRLYPGGSSARRRRRPGLPAVQGGGRQPPVRERGLSPSAPPQRGLGFKAVKQADCQPFQIILS